MPILPRLRVGAALAIALISVCAAGGDPEPSPAGSSYIVVLKDGVDPGRVALAQASFGADVDQVYRSALKGFTLRLSTQQVAALRADPQVASVEPDAVVTGTGQTLPAGVNRIDADLSTTRAGNGSGSVGVTNAYIIDTGISQHPDLNLVAHHNWTGDGKNYDCNGHGTHVAGIIGAKDNGKHVVGVAPGVALTGLKVLGCNRSGLISHVVAALDWVTKYAKKPAVVNLSLSAAASPALDTAVRTSAAAGVLIVIAAGNSGANACNYSPARAGAGTDNGIITVAATGSSSGAATFSNYGSCVDSWAPGVSVVSTYNNGGTASMSGTSMAAPHVAGAAALYQSRYKTAHMPSVEKVLRTRGSSTGGSSRDGRAIKLVYARSF